jgi:2-oxoglutarate dehydrogenase E2 component (dihydrolipoamide succinyltransferase)
VRKIARENNVDLRQVAGTGLSGRVTKQDILGYIDNRPTAVGAAPSVVAPALPTIPVAITPTAPAVAPTAAPAVTAPAVASIPVFPAYQTGDRVEITPMTPIRRKTAEHMVASKRTSAHVTTLFEIDLTNVVKIRDKYKDKFLAEHGIKLTFMPFIMKSAIEALRLWPIVNASVDGDNIVYKKDINLGVAVALDWGLIVPVIKNAEEKNLVGLSRALNDLAGRARSKQLKPQEIQGGTFTITNPGMYGSLFGTPIINQPQVAIMGIGTIEKRLTVMPDDSIAIRTKAYFSLSFDHRIIDGAIADQFMAQVKKNMENFTAAEL